MEGKQSTLLWCEKKGRREQPELLSALMNTGTNSSNQALISAPAKTNHDAKAELKDKR